MSNTADQDHYSDEDWVDFARDTVTPGEAGAMRRHLDEGCNACRKVFETWKAVLGIVKKEPAFEPPAGAVQLAKALFTVSTPQRRDASTWATAKLLFDSHLMAASGVRTLRSSPRKLLFESQNFHIDLQVEPSKDGAKIAMIGQVLPLDENHPQVAGLQVLLVRSATLIARTRTNPLGEFRVDLDGAGENVSLAVELSHTAIVIPLSAHIGAA